MKVSSDLVRCGARVSATDDSAPVTGRVPLITHRLHMLPIKIGHAGTRLAKSTHPVTLLTSVDKVLNTCSMEKGERTVGRGGRTKGNVYMLKIHFPNAQRSKLRDRCALITHVILRHTACPSLVLFIEGSQG